MDGPDQLDARVTEADVEALFQAILHRPTGDPAYCRLLAGSGMTLRQLIVELRACNELKAIMRDELRITDHVGTIDPLTFRAPTHLSATGVKATRVLMIGSCLMETWRHVLSATNTPVAIDLYLSGADLPVQPAHSVGDYDFQLIHLPLRSMLPDGAFARLRQDDIAGHEALFAHATTMMQRLLGQAMQWNRAHGILTFVMPMIVPQQNPVGRLLPRFDLRNQVYFIEKLNEAMDAALRGYANAFYFDLNEVLATHGRRLVQEDMIAQANHGSFLMDFDFSHDGERLEPAVPASAFYDRQLPLVIGAAWHELLALLRTIRAVDPVKLVVIDLDDTLWRGVAAEMAIDALPTSEGWPNGFRETLRLLKRRGILLAIISRNDERTVETLWPSLMGHQLALDDFVARRINWRAKSENMSEILAEVNLLPGNVLYIDDNPTQRGEMQAAFAQMRVLGGQPYTWRHILLWSAETQTAGVTGESAARTEMVRAQIAREEQRLRVSPDDFLAGLAVKLTFFRVYTAAHPRFARVLELINKTNQFNTTGQRRSAAELTAALARGAECHAFDLVDSHTQYGLVGALILDANTISQFVMSCRVMGLGAERAAIAHIVALLRGRGVATLTGAIVPTERNLPCRNLYALCGFEQIDGSWRRDTSPPLDPPPHITLVARTPQ